MMERRCHFSSRILSIESAERRSQTQRTAPPLCSTEPAFPPPSDLALLAEAADLHPLGGLQVGLLGIPRPGRSRAGGADGL